MKVGMRIGINSGTITAGVIGKTKFIYDIWGDTVNTASRMEHYGKEGMITVSQVTYDLVKSDAELSEREEQVMKGKGLMQIYRIK
ncbi:MAG: adenylate/guanylate cyclase domain-containing protein [Spirochaetales bacterium]|nr:adenylate/guanylate cyclase domain-containing protein [Spirochaetales bacterium]